MSSNTVQSTTNTVSILRALRQFSADLKDVSLDNQPAGMLRLMHERIMAILAQVSGSTKLSVYVCLYNERQATFYPTTLPTTNEAKYNALVKIGWQVIHSRQTVDSSQLNGATPATLQDISAWVCMPMLAHKDALGVLYVCRDDGVALFSEVERLVLEHCVDVVAMALYQWRQDTPDHSEPDVAQLKKLNWATQSINSRTNLSDTLQEILNIGLDLTGAQYGSFELYDKAHHHLVTHAAVGLHIERGKLRPLPVNLNSVVGRVAISREPILVHDVREHPWSGIHQPLPFDQEMRSELAVPLVSAENTLEGVLNIESPHTHAFSEADARLLESLAAQAVTAIQEVRLLDAMHEIVELLLTTSADEFFARLIDRACDLVNVSAGAIWTIVESDKLLLRQATAGYERGSSFLLRGTLAEQAIRLGKPLRIDDVCKHSDFHGRQLARQHGWTSAIFVPLSTSRSKKDALGCFVLFSTTLRDFSAWDEKLLMTLARHASVAIGPMTLTMLSEREQEVMRYLIQGQTNKEISNQMSISVNTVKKHLQNIFTKLGVDTRTAAVAKALSRE